MKKSLSDYKSLHIHFTCTHRVLQPTLFSRLDFQDQDTIYPIMSCVRVDETSVLTHVHRKKYRPCQHKCESNDLVSVQVQKSWLSEKGNLERILYQ